MEKELIIQLAKEAGLVYNTTLMQSEVYPHHRKALYLFASLVEFKTQQSIAERFEGDAAARTKVLMKV